MRVAALALLLACAACSGASSDPAVIDPVPSEDLPLPAYAWVWLHAGDAAETLAQADVERAQAGHFENMQRLAEAGDLLLAGPLWAPRAAATHRGVFLFRRGSVALAEELAGSDPAVQAGLLRMEVEPFTTEADLAAVARRHADWVAASGIENPSPGVHSQGYVLLLGRPAGIARRVLEHADLRVLLHGTLGSGAELGALAVLDYRSAEELPDPLPGADSISWSVMPWFSTEELVAD